jgi:predicted O-methyltransferase YrrM
MGLSIGEARQSAAALAWYLRRPALHRELLRRVARRVTSGRASARKLRIARAEATEWCAYVRSDAEALAATLGVPARPEPVSRLHPDEWQAALRAVERCPVRMGGPGHLDLIYHLVYHLRPTTVVETGVAYGWSTLAILLAMERRGEGRLFSVDMPYEGQESDPWMACVVPTPLRWGWTLIRKPDRDALPALMRDLGTIDFAHYDSDKSYDGRLFAYRLLYRHLSPGGVLMSDDVDDNLGFRDFTRGLGLQPLVLRRQDGRYVGLVQKPGGA